MENLVNDHSGLEKKPYLAVSLVYLLPWDLIVGITQDSVIQARDRELLQLCVLHLYMLVILYCPFYCNQILDEAL
uniref:Uncharacterized protein n=1 Tax=Rhizophora mucronata TaxID=61149 RepID=A0A2P2N2E8_RHIMU